MMQMLAPTPLSDLERIGRRVAAAQQRGRRLERAPRQWRAVECGRRGRGRGVDECVAGDAGGGGAWDAGFGGGGAGVAG